MPKTMNVAVTSVVKTGRRMQSFGKAHRQAPGFSASRGATREPFGQQQLTFRDDRFAALEAAFEHRLAVDERAPP